jgi:hypothetical protein
MRGCFGGVRAVVGTRHLTRNCNRARFRRTMREDLGVPPLAALRSRP